MCILRERFWWWHIVSPPYAGDNSKLIFLSRLHCHGYIRFNSLHINSFDVSVLIYIIFRIRSLFRFEFIHCSLALLICVGNTCVRFRNKRVNYLKCRIHIRHFLINLSHAIIFLFICCQYIFFCHPFRCLDSRAELSSDSIVRGCI